MSECLSTFQMLTPPVVAVAGAYAGYSFGKATDLKGDLDNE